MKRGLTVRQVEVLSYVRGRIAAGLVPTVREVAAHFGMGHHGAYCHLKALERKGCVARAGRTSRTLGVTHAVGHPVRIDLASGTCASESGGGAGVAYRIGAL